MSTCPATHPLRRRTLLRSAVASSLPAIGAAHDLPDDLPAGPFRLVVGSSAGDGIDHAARLLARYLSTHTHKAFVVENKPGANGIIAAEYVAKTQSSNVVNIFVGMSSQLLLNQLLYTKLPLDLNTDLQRLYVLSIGSHYLCVNPAQIPATSLQELLAHMKANKSKLSHGSFGPGSYPHLMGIRLNQLTGADMTQVTYKGETPTVFALLNGTLDIGWASAASIKQHAGKLLPLAGNGTERMPEGFPDVPTFAEAGLSDEAFTLQGWIGAALPAHTPNSVKLALGQAIHHVMNASGLPAQYHMLGMPVVSDSGPAHFESFYQRVYPQWEKLVRTVGVKLD